MFEVEMPVNEAPLDSTEINQVLLYYSNEELADFRRLCKKGIPELMPDYKTKGNVADFLLILLKKHYA